jgi:hypothetical protein
MTFSLRMKYDASAMTAAVMGIKGKAIKLENIHPK